MADPIESLAREQGYPVDAVRQVFDQHLPSPVELTGDERREVAAVLAWAADLMIGNANDYAADDDADPELQAELRDRAALCRRVAARLSPP